MRQLANEINVQMKLQMPQVPRQVRENTLVQISHKT